MKYLKRTLVAVAVLGFSASASFAAPKQIKKERQFIEFVADKKATSGSSWIIVHSNGSITGMNPKQGKIVGKWAWNKRFWCRNITVGKKTWPQDCQTVTLDGNKVTYKREKGKGEPSVWTLE